MLYRRFVRLFCSITAMSLTGFSAVASTVGKVPGPRIHQAAGSVASLPSKQEATIRQYLYEAQDALAYSRLTSPRHDNAFDGYRRVLALDPGNAQARSGIRHISKLYFSMANKAQAAGDYEKALGYARLAQRIAPGSENEQLLQSLEQQRANQPAQELRPIRSGENQAAVKLNVRGNEYLLEMRDIAARNLKAKTQLVEISSKVREYDSRILIIARSDEDGRWIYSQMRDALNDFRLRGNIKTGSQVRIVLLDQPLATANTEAAADVSVTSLPATSPTTTSPATTLAIPEIQ